MNSKIAELLDVKEAELDYLLALDGNSQQRLAGDIEAAQETSREEIKQAADEAISHLPKLIQKPLRKLFP